MTNNSTESRRVRSIPHCILRVTERERSTMVRWNTSHKHKQTPKLFPLFTDCFVLDTLTHLRFHRLPSCSMDYSSMSYADSSPLPSASMSFHSEMYITRHGEDHKPHSTLFHYSYTSLVSLIISINQNFPSALLDRCPTRSAQHT